MKEDKIMQRKIIIVNASIKPFIFQEICDNPEFIIEGTSRFDLIQGELGKAERENC